MGKSGSLCCKVKPPVESCPQKTTKAFKLFLEIYGWRRAPVFNQGILSLEFRRFKSWSRPLQNYLSRFMFEIHHRYKLALPWLICKAAYSKSLMQIVLHTSSLPWSSMRFRHSVVATSLVNWELPSEVVSCRFALVKRSNQHIGWHTTLPWQWSRPLLQTCNPLTTHLPSFCLADI